MDRQFGPTFSGQEEAMQTKPWAPGGEGGDRTVGYLYYCLFNLPWDPVKEEMSPINIINK